MNVRVAFWQELTVTVRHVRSTVDLPMVIVAGDANVWHPYFSLGRSRSVDNLVVPFIDLLITSCGFRLINPPDQATHVAGAALDLMLISSHCPCSMLVHSGLQCCVEAPGCCPIVGSDHYLCVASASLVHRPAHVQSRRLLLCAIGPQENDQLYDQLLSVLSYHSPRPRIVLRRQPSWWTTSVALRASPGMVRGGTIVGIQIPFCTLDSERLVWHSIEQCARPVARFGRNGNLVSHHSLSLSLDWQLPSSATLSVAQLIRVATNQIK